MLCFIIFRCIVVCVQLLLSSSARLPVFRSTKRPYQIFLTRERKSLNQVCTVLLYFIFSSRLSVYQKANPAPALLILYTCSPVAARPFRTTPWEDAHGYSRFGAFEDPGIYSLFRKGRATRLYLYCTPFLNSPNSLYPFRRFPFSGLLSLGLHPRPRPSCFAIEKFPPY